MKYKLIIFDFDGTLADPNEILKYLDVPLWKIPVIANHMRKLIHKDIHQISLFEGIYNLLQCLSNKGITLAVVSSNSYDNICRVLGAKKYRSDRLL